MSIQYIKLVCSLCEQVMEFKVIPLVSVPPVQPPYEDSLHLNPPTNVGPDLSHTGTVVNTESEIFQTISIQTEPDSRFSTPLTTFHPSMRPMQIQAPMRPIPQPQPQILRQATVIEYSPAILRYHNNNNN